MSIFLHLFNILQNKHSVVNPDDNESDLLDTIKHNPTIPHNQPDSNTYIQTQHGYIAIPTGILPPQNL